MTEKKINSDELEFAIFCIENLAKKLHTDAPTVFSLLTEKTDILYTYIIPCYDVLHTQDKNYILDDILDVLKKKGVGV